MRRAVDICASLVGIVLATPVVLVAAAMVRGGLGSPVWFRQQRAGRHGKAFSILKLRTTKRNVSHWTLECAFRM